MIRDVISEALSRPGEALLDLLELVLLTGALLALGVVAWAAWPVPS